MTQQPIPTQPITWFDRLDPHAPRALVVTVTAVDAANGVCTVSPPDGKVVEDVPYYGGAPDVGAMLIALQFDNMLAVVSGGGGSGATGGSEEVVIQADEPVYTPGLELWLDTDEVSVTATGGNEVFIGDATTRATMPALELWVDTDEIPYPVVDEVAVQSGDPLQMTQTAEIWFDLDAEFTQPTGPAGPPGATGATGPQGIATTIVGEFVTRAAAELPVDGFMPADWDGPGTFPGGYQMVVGQALINNNPGSTTFGDLWQFVGPADPEGWINVGQVVGPPGASGPTGPTGPPGTASAAGVVTPAALVNGFSGIAEFKINDAMVTLTLVNVVRNASHNDGQIKICDYPPGAAPWQTQQQLNHGMKVKPNGYIDLVTGVPALILARVDGVFLGIMSNSADWTTDQAVNVQMTWAR